MNPLLHTHACLHFLNSRYRHLPGVDRRLDTVVKTHILGLVSTTKGHMPPPLPQVAAELWGSPDGAVSLLRGLQPGLQRLFLRSCAVPVLANDETSMSAYQQQTTVRKAVGVLSDLGVFPDAAELLSAARAFVHDYMQANLFNSSSSNVQRMQLESEEDGPEVMSEAAAAAMNEAEEREILAWMDAPLIFPEYVEAVVRLADQLPRDGANGLGVRLEHRLLDPEVGILPALERSMNLPAPIN